MEVSLKQIAAELGISYTLVSKVLSGRMSTTGVSAVKKEAILRKAKELDYQPNPLAVALKRGRKGAVGVFMHTMGEPGSELGQSLLRSMAGMLNQTGERVWLRFFESDEEFLATCDEKLSREVDGLIVAGVHHPGIADRLHEIEKNGLPVVLTSSTTSSLGFQATVAVDNEQQGYLPTKYLLDRGCRRIAHFHTIDVRYRGFLRAHEDAGVAVNERLVIPTGERFSTEAGMQAARGMLASGEKCDAIVCASDAQAIGAYRVLSEQGVRVPEGIQLTGVDDSPLARINPIPLTTVTAEMDACGRVAAQMLLDLIAAKPVESVLIKPLMVIRESTM